MGIALNVIMLGRRVCCQLLIVLPHKQPIGTGRLDPPVNAATKHRSLPIRPERHLPLGVPGAGFTASRRERSICAFPPPPFFPSNYPQLQLRTQVACDATRGCILSAQTRGAMLGTWTWTGTAVQSEAGRRYPVCPWLSSVLYPSSRGESKPILPAKLKALLGFPLSLELGRGGP